MDLFVYLLLLENEMEIPDRFTFSIAGYPCQKYNAVKNGEGFDVSWNVPRWEHPLTSYVSLAQFKHLYSIGYYIDIKEKE